LIWKSVMLRCRSFASTLLYLTLKAMFLHHTTMVKIFMDSCKWAPTLFFHASKYQVLWPNLHIPLDDLSTSLNTQDMSSSRSSFHLFFQWFSPSKVYLLWEIVLPTELISDHMILLPHLSSKDIGLEHWISVISQQFLATQFHKH